MTAVQEGNSEGMVLQILLKVLFNLKQGFAVGQVSIFISEKWRVCVCVVVEVRNIEFWTWKGPLDSCVNLCPLTHFHLPLPYMSWNLEETIGRAPDGALGAGNSFGSETSSLCDGGQNLPGLLSFSVCLRKIMSAFA